MFYSPPLARVTIGPTDTGIICNNDNVCDEQLSCDDGSAVVFRRATDAKCR